MSTDQNLQHNTSAKSDSSGSKIDSGAVNAGGDVIGHDKIIHGDEVGGDKIQGDKNTYIMPSNPAIARAQRNHAALRDAVRFFWIDGVLKNSLYNELLIRLKMTQQPDAVNNRPWNLILQQPDQPDHAIADDKQIIDIFNQMRRQMLILGAPGSGKTITLLTLADALLVEAQANPTLPTPAVFNLSSWTEGQLALGEWLVEELNQRYHMPRKVAEDWVENDELLLLLDGLDEVAADKRYDCMSAINRFQNEHIVNMVVCSRIAEYQVLTDRLNLTGAIVIRPLTDQQIDNYIASTAPHLADLDQALTDSLELRELAQTPLMLNIMTLTYHDQHEDSQSTLAIDRSEQQNLFDGYIHRMFQHRDLPHLYTPAQTLQWLQWLAAQMAKHSQTTFYIKRLQPDWLGSKQGITLYQLIVELIIGLISGLIGWLIGGLIVGLIVGLISGLIGGLISGLISDSYFNVYEEVNELIGGLIGGLIVGMIFGPIIGLIVWLFVGLIGGWLIVGLTVGLIGGLIVGLNIWLIVGPIVWLISGIPTSVTHFTLRILLTLENHIPRNYARFLDYAASRLFLRKVGGGYIFIHRMVLEHIAALTDADIERITANLQGR